ncbi:unnamed protein product [Rotaria sp. Silwood2]|nr:unnamed protein product [Rotaria sp. Silwood2]CAF4229866.1 unnamed protein product [Rotaria sp. Silwood2]
MIYDAEIYIQDSQKHGEPRHFNINIWQTRSNINNSYGLCTGSTCSSEPERSLIIDYQRSSYSPDIIILICNIYISNYLKSMAPEPWERSLHYNRTIENVQKACRADVQQADWPHVRFSFDGKSLSKISFKQT